eukprot:1084305-Rhodomonas_salina.2
MSGADMAYAIRRKIQEKPAGWRCTGMHIPLNRDSAVCYYQSEPKAAPPTSTKPAKEGMLSVLSVAGARYRESAVLRCSVLRYRFCAREAQY